MNEYASQSGSPKVIPDFALPARIFAALAGLIAVAVIVGWHIASPFLIQLHAGLVPMTYNAALLLLLASVTLILLTCHHIVLPRVLAAISMLFSAVTMAQYFAGFDAGIDQLFMQYYITAQSAYPGRMAISTAFSYAVLNAAFLMYTLGGVTLRWAAAIGAAIVIASVIATVIGYEADLQPLFGWSATTHMALHSALGLFLLGLALFAISSSTAVGDDEVEANHALIATVGFIVIVTATLLLWSGLTRQRDEQLQSALNADLRWLGISINALFEERANTIERMSRRWEVSGGTAKMVWEEDAASYVDTLDGVQAVYRIDPEGRVQWSVPDQGGSLRPGTDVLSLAELATAFTLARDNAETVYSMPYQRGDAEQHFLLIRPLAVNGMHDGFIVADFNTDTLFDLVEARDPGVPFRVYYDGLIVFSSAAASDLVSSPERIGRAPLRIASDGWELEVFPPGADVRSRLPNVVLVSGILLALLLVAVLHLWGLSRRALVAAARANAELVRSEGELNRFRTTLDRTLDCVFMFDAQSYRFFYGNAGALRMTGLSYEQLLDKQAWDMNPARDEQGFRDLVAPLLNEEQDALTFDSVMATSQGGIVPVECFIQYIAPVNESPRFVAIVRDITQRKRIEQMKSEFVSTVSHELRTPLTSISGALGLVAGGALGDVPAPALDMIHIAYNNSRRLTHLINDLLDIEKIAAGKVVFDMQVQPLMPLVDQAVEATRTYGSENKVTLRVVQSVTGVDVRVDSQRLQQVLSNLLSNAIKFSPEGGSVDIVVEHRAPKVRISVCDHGRGIPEEFRNRIFQKFAQADASDTRRQSGTGLGLAISRELAERMNGHLDFDSVPGDGACFWLELPVANERLLVADGDKTPILIVEDDTDAALLLRKLLDDAGYSADIAGHGAAALRALEERQYAAVVLDLLLPDMNGIDIIRRLRAQQQTRTLPVIVASAHTENGKLTISGDVPSIVWMPKPVDQALFLGELRELIARSKRPCHVLHIEDDTDLHRVIRTMVGSECEFAHATDMKEARALLERHKADAFDVVILDLGLPDGSGWELLPDIKAAMPNSRLVILTGQDTSQLDLRKVDSVLLKSRMTPRQLLDAIHAAGLRPPSTD
ncbi:MAG TPA: ATP-binding protein [Pseudomonadales bacterium]